MRRASLVALTLAFVPLALGGCAGPPPEEKPADQSYPLRAIVVALPPPGAARPHLELHHDAVPGFVSSAGAVVGMDSMTMTFPLADAGELAGIAVGDKVAFDLEIRWADSDPTLVRNLRKLPADTVLGFETPPAPPEPAP